MSQKSEIARVESVLDAFHAAASTADEQRYLELLTADAVFLGTDASERWAGEHYRGRQRAGEAGHALEARNREQLYAIAKEQDIRGRSKMGKWDLIEAIRKSR